MCGPWKRETQEGSQMNMSDAVERMEHAFPTRTFIFGVTVQRTVFTFSEPAVTIVFSLSLFPEGKSDSCEIVYGPSLENVVEQQIAKRHPTYLDEVDAALSVVPATVE
jgi:hypothetical protein